MGKISLRIEYPRGKNLGNQGKRAFLVHGQNPQCRGCSLHREAETVCIFGRGNVSAKIVLVGEAPGKNEDERGEPFVGRSGVYLNSVLNRLGIRDQCYLTNVVKCRPPNNRDPTRVEYDTCVPYFDLEMAVVKPKILVVLGNVAKKALGLDAKSGVGFYLQTQWYSTYTICTYHPAYCLRMGPLMRAVFEAHLRWTLIHLKGEK